MKMKFKVGKLTVADVNLEGLETELEGNMGEIKELVTMILAEATAFDNKMKEQVGRKVAPVVSQEATPVEVEDIIEIDGMKFTKQQILAKIKEAK